MMRKFEANDILEIGALRPEQSESESVLSYFKSHTHELEYYTLFTYVNKKGKITSITGWTALREQLFTVIQLNSESFLQDIAGEEGQFIKECSELYKNAAPGRYQTYVKTDFAQGIKFAETVGFELEGLMRSYLLGADCFLYSIIIK